MTPETLHLLYQRHAFALLRRCRALLREPEEARDAVQEVFVRALEDPDGFQGRSSPATFLYGVATHVCLNRLRDRAARGGAWQAGVARTLEEDRVRPGDVAEMRQLARAILAEADAETAAIAVYHFVDGLSQGEIAALVGLSRVTINQRLQRFREAARRRAEAP